MRNKAVVIRVLQIGLVKVSITGDPHGSFSVAADKTKDICLQLSLG